VIRVVGIIAAIALAATAAGCGGGTATTTSTGSAAATTASTATAESAQGGAPRTSTCASITTPTTEGPYYVTGTAALTGGNLNAAGLPGERIRITGHVYSGADKHTPLPNAIVDIWQADADGTYWPASNGPADGYADAELRLRGHVATAADGTYSFTTILPGEYEGRPRHIHVRATSGDGTQDVVTQLIVSRPGDRTPASADAIARSLPACHTMRFTTVRGTPTAAFDFHLAGA